jgi:hypothetical protein
MGALVCCAVVLDSSGVHALYAASVRDRLRPTDVQSTAVNDSQATDVNLTIASVAEQPIQVWVRTAGALDQTGRVLTAVLDEREGRFVQVGQRARAFQITSRSSMYQARITRVTPGDGRIAVEATLTTVGPKDDAPFIFEIVIDRGRFLAVPNAAIIEEGDKHIVYVQHHPGSYVPMEIHTGIQGELYTQVLHGVDAGDEVVTFGSFFVDAEYKLKASGGGDAAVGHEHHHH